MNPATKLIIGSALIAAILTFGFLVGGMGVGYAGTKNTISVSDLYSCLGRSNIYFVVTLGTEGYLRSIGAWEMAEHRLLTAQPFVITANTHIGSIRDLNIDGRVFLVSEGVEYPAIGKAISLSTHHNTYLVFFPRYDMDGEPIFEKKSGNFDIIIKGIDIDRRIFTFSYPLTPLMSGSRMMQINPVHVLMMAAAAIAGLSLACSPCLFGAMMVGSLTVSTSSVSNPEMIRRRRTALRRNVIFFLASLVVSYMAIAIVTATLRIDIAALRPVEILGGVILLVFGLAFIRLWRPVAMLENTVAKLMLRLKPSFANYIEDGAPTQPSLNPRLASTMGSCLSLVCSTAGAPTLSTSIVLPLMVYAGLGSLEWSFMVLLAYLAAVSVPFLLVTLGLGELLLMRSYEVMYRLMVINAFLLISVGALLLIGPGTVLEVLSSSASL